MNSFLVARLYADEPIGTGYPIGQNHILTAWHVVDGLSVKDIELQWFAKADERHPSDICSVKEIIVYDDWKKHDIAVLACDLPDRVKMLFKSVYFAQSMYPTRSSWQTIGYPRVEGFLQKGSSGTLGVQLNKCSIDLNLDTSTHEENLQT